MREDAEHSATEKIVLAMPLASVILAHAGIQNSFNRFLPPARDNPCGYPSLTSQVSFYHFIDFGNNLLAQFQWF